MLSFGFKRFFGALSEGNTSAETVKRGGGSVCFASQRIMRIKREAYRFEALSSS